MPRKIRPIRIEGNVAFVPLTQGYEAIIDAADVPLVEGWAWWAQVIHSRSGGGLRTVYAIRSFTAPNGKRTSMRMHRVIAETSDGLETDHIDGNGLNNRRENLRVATTAENNRNARMRADNTSGAKGVSFRRSRGTWCAYVRLDGKRTYSSHATFAEAEAAVKQRRSEKHGEFGRDQ